MQTRLGVAHRGRAVAVDGVKVALPIHQRVAQRKILRHARHGLIDRRVAVWMVLAQYLTHDARRLFVGGIGPQAQLVHSIKDAALDRFETIASIRQGTGDDDAHRIVQVCDAHLVIDIYQAYCANLQI